VSPPRRVCAHCGIPQLDKPATAADDWYWVRTPAAGFVDLCCWSCLRAWIEAVVP
jgi:hypothetical protein